jgi:hypothetical protein
LKTGEGVAVGVAVLVGVAVRVAVAVAEAVGVADLVAVAVELEVGVALSVAVAVAVLVGVAETVAVAVFVAVAVVVAVEVAVLVGVAVGDGGSPTPMSFTFCGLFAPASVNVSRPCLNLPFDGGVKVTETGQVPDGGIVLVHPFVPRLKPVPVTLTTGAARSTLPLLVSVTFC